jgi:hypothetical protein
LPIPEETERVLSVTVVPRRLSQSCRCAVRVKKTGKVSDLLDAVKALRVGLLGPCDSQPNENLDSAVHQQFLVGEMVGNRVRRFVSPDKRLDAVRETDQLVVFEVEFSPSLCTRLCSESFPVGCSTTMISTDPAVFPIKTILQSMTINEYSTFVSLFQFIRCYLSSASHFVVDRSVLL